ncbi:MAG: GNAT family N-acetyltransferase, partial [Dichotomicrobium sp.]
MSFRIRPATPRDREAVAALLRASYGTLLRDAYDAGVLERALPFLTRPNPSLLACGTYYIAEFSGLGPCGCGGWTFARPGDPQARIDATVGHVRHFATHPDAVRQGVGQCLMDTCVEVARGAGVRRLECVSTRQAVPFYRAVGFCVLAPVPVRLG